MTRRVPEFALVTGLFLGLSTLVAGVALTDDVLTTALVAAAVSYPFVAYAVVRDEDPTTVAPPRAVLAAGVLAGAALFAASTFDRPSFANATFGLFVGLLVALPPVAYAVAFEAGVNPLSPRTTVFAGVAVATLLLLAGLLVGSAVVGAANALLVGLSAGMYGASRGVRFGARTRRAAVAVGVLLGVGVVAVGAVRNEPLGDWVVAGMALALGPSVYYALTAKRFDSRRRRTRR